MFNTFQCYWWQYLSSWWLRDTVSPKEARSCQRRNERNKHCKLFWMVFCLQCQFHSTTLIFPNLWGITSGLHLWLCFWSLHQAWVECLAICIARCVWIPEEKQHTVDDTHTHTLVQWTAGTLIHPRSWGTQTNSNWSMECLYGQTSGFHEDQTCSESPIVISSYALQLELNCIGRCLPLDLLCMCLCDPYIVLYIG